MPPTISPPIDGDAPGSSPQPASGDTPETIGKHKRRWWTYKRTWFLGLPLVLVAAAGGLFMWGELQPRPPGYAPTDPEAGAIITDEWAQFTIDVDTGRDYALFDLNEGRLVDGDFTTPGWDLAFRKTTILTNSGTTNPDGSGGALDLGEIPLIEAVVPERVSFTVDSLGGENNDRPTNTELRQWYGYDFFRHIVNATDNTFLVRTDGKRDALIKFDSYYCEDGGTRCLTLRYRLVPKVKDPGFATAGGKDESAVAS